MKKLLLSLVLTLVLPAFAQSASSQWAVEYPGASYCQAMYNGAANPPVIGTDVVGVPAGSTVVPFVPLNGDQEVTHYSIVNGALLWNAPNGVRWANPLTVENAVFSDPQISNLGKAAILPYKSIIDTYNFNPANAMASWQLLLATTLSAAGNPAWAAHDADVVQIQNDCAAQGMSLVASKGNLKSYLRKE